MGLVAAGSPDNLRGSFGHLVEADVFSICDRIKEVDRNLVIYVMPSDSRRRFSIVEMCRDNVERLVFTTDELDGRVIERLQYLLRVPFEKRLAAAEAIEEKAKEEQHEREHQELYEQIGAPMLRDLERCGFIQRPRSFAKRGIRLAA
jgi:hypothetical protein